MNKSNKYICVIGIGRFGTAVVKQLIELKKHVLAIDKSEENLKNVSDLTDSYVADGVDIEALKAIGINLFETVIVAASENIEIVASLIELGVKNIIAKAKSATYERVLKHLGVDIIIRPEYEIGLRTAFMATSPSLIKYSKSLQEIGDGYAIGTTTVINEEWIKKPLKDLKFSNLGVSVVSIRRGSHVMLPSGDAEIIRNDLITVVGKNNNIINTFAVLNDDKNRANNVKSNKANLNIL